MYLRSRRKIPVTAWLAPILIVLIVTAAIVVDYREQHRNFSVFGTSVDSHNIRQVLVQPQPDAPTRTRPQVYKITAHNQLVALLRILSQAQFHAQAAGIEQNSSILDNLFVEFQTHSWQLSVLKSPLSNHLYIQYNGKLFETSTQLVQAIKKQP